jgi:hypothetical protein
MKPRDDDLAYSTAKVTENGKYLFFTPDDTAALENIVFDQFRIRPFESAKIPTTDNQREEDVLCLYYKDDRYNRDLRQTYQNEEESRIIASPYEAEKPVIKPRGYRKNGDTGDF